MINIFRVHATWQTKSGRKGELQRRWVGPDIDSVRDSVYAHIKSDRRFSAVRAIDITVTKEEANV